MSGAEVLAVFGALSSILQVIDFTGRVASNAHDIVVLKKDATQSNAEAKSLALQYEGLGERLADLSVNATHATAGEQTVKELGKQCHDKAQDLLSQLEKLSLSQGKTGIKRLADGTAKAVKATTQRKDILRQRQDLQELNGQLATAILRTLLEKQQDFPKATQQIIDAVKQSTEDAIGKALALMEGEKAIRERTKELLGRLSFEAIESRWKSIEQAYDSTYCWALESDTLAFRSWLREGVGTFWITGKAGSGKSTFMKFLSDQEKTRTLLEEWSGNKQLIFASYYFWYAGSSLQKSTEGLLRTILYRILSEMPALVPSAFEEWYPQANVGASRSLRDFTHNELMIAWDRIVRNGMSQSHHKFCLFIDGLDEYHGNHGELVTLLDSLVKNTDIKLCISSRPWNAFLAAYDAKVPSLRLEDLTINDIWQYVNGKITSASITYGQASTISSSTIALLVADIARRAEGVFLWVYLVVNSVLRGLAEGDGISFLQHRVETFPADLDGYFASILDRADTVYKMQSHQMLYYACLCVAESPSRASYLDFWLIGKDPRGITNPDFAFDLDPRSTTPSIRAEMKPQTRRFLSASCKDLLQLHNDDVDFLHRTVYDFLIQDEMQAKLKATVPSFFMSIAILESFELARQKLEWTFKSLALRIVSLGNLVRRLNGNRRGIATSPEEIKVKFAAECEQLLLRALEDAAYPHKLSSTQEHLFLETFAGFQCYEFPLKHLRKLKWQTNIDNEIYIDGKPTDEKEIICRVLHCSLGCSKFRALPIERVINVDFVDLLLKWGRRETGPGAEIVHSLSPWRKYRNYGGRFNFEYACCEFDWQVLLRRWYLASRNRQLRDPRNVWEAMKLFLAEAKSDLDDFCVRPAGDPEEAGDHPDQEEDSEEDRAHPEPEEDSAHPGQEHLWVNPKQFFANNLPREWLLETAYTRDLVDAELNETAGRKKGKRSRRKAAGHVKSRLAAYRK